MYLKKTILLFITCLYAFSNSGLAMNVHFCGNAVSGISFLGVSGEEQCCCGKKKMKKGCCKQVKQYFKLKDTHKPNVQLKVNNVLSFTIPVCQAGTFNKSVYCVALDMEQYHPPTINSLLPITFTQLLI